MDFAVSSYSFANAHIDELDLPKKAKEMGFDAIEFAEIHPGNMDKKEYAKLLREKCDEANIRISNYAIGADFINGCGGYFNDEVERLFHEIDIAEILGVHLVRHDCTVGYQYDYMYERQQIGFQQALKWIIVGCTQVTEYAESKNIRTMIENHGRFCQESTRLEQIVTGVANENFGLLLDMGNFLCADENPIEAFGRLAPFVFYVHAKDFHVKSGNGVRPQNGFFTTRGGNFLRGAIIGHGEVPILQCLRILRENKYDSWVSVEFEGMEDPITGISCGFENLKYLDSLD